MRLLLDATSVQRGLTRVAGQLAERHRGTGGLVLVGIRRGGVALAEALRGCLGRLEPGGSVAMGTVDITLYRDDASSAMPNPRIGPSEIPGSLDGRRVVLVDDVIGTGRTVRAAIDAVLDYGRPESIELFALVDRGGRQLPIQPDYCVLVHPVGPSERVDVVGEGSALQAMVQPVGAPAALGTESRGQS